MCFRHKIPFLAKPFYDDFLDKGFTPKISFFRIICFVVKLPNWHVSNSGGRECKCNFRMFFHFLCLFVVLFAFSPRVCILPISPGIEIFFPAFLCMFSRVLGYFNFIPCFSALSSFSPSSLFYYIVAFSNC